MIKAIVTDVEGTLSPTSFVTEILFPYAREHLCPFLHEHSTDMAVSIQLENLSREENKALSVQECCDVLSRWMADDSKSAILKALQGMVWQEGYAKGELHGELFEDAVRNLRRWNDKGLALFAYSSGSVQAQQLLFQNNPFGDLTRLFSGYFDTKVGHKLEPSSYELITSEINERAGDILFLSDSVDELNAARAAGMQTRHVVRDTKPLDTMAAHPQVRDFDAISLD